MRDAKPHYVPIISMTKSESSSASGSTIGALVCMETRSQALISGNATSFAHPIETSKISDMGANAGLMFTDAAHLVIGHIDKE